MSRSGTEYGALVDLPDWSYVGRLAIADIFVDWTLIACFTQMEDQLQSQRTNSFASESSMPSEYVL